MTPSKLKEQLMEEWFNRNASDQCELLGSLIDILIEQQAALDEIAGENFGRKRLGHGYAASDKNYLMRQIATKSLASTNAKLKALGCDV